MAVDTKPARERRGTALSLKEQQHLGSIFPLLFLPAALEDCPAKHLPSAPAQGEPGSPHRTHALCVWMENSHSLLTELFVISMWSETCQPRITPLAFIYGAIPDSCRRKAAETSFRVPVSEPGLECHWTGSTLAAGYRPGQMDIGQAGISKWLLRDIMPCNLFAKHKPTWCSLRETNRWRRVSHQTCLLETMTPFSICW